MSNFDYYEMKRPGVCRGCSCALEKGQIVLHTYTSIGKGMELYFCDECQFEMAAMFVERYNKLEDFGEEIVMKKLSN